MGTPLPQSVYDDLADPSKPTVTFPVGNFDLVKPLVAKRPVTWNTAGCVLAANPLTWGGDFYPVQILSGKRTDVVFGHSPSGVGKRYSSGLTGEINADTTQLTMNETVDVQPGETVLILAGVQKGDPVEPLVYLPATIKSVNGLVITFENTLGWNVTNWGSLAEFKAAVDPSLQWKVGNWGAWPSDANYSKGFGIDHGMQRFVGGAMTKGVTINGPLNLQLTSLAGAPIATVPNGNWEVLIQYALDVKINGLTVNNPAGSVVHCWGSFNVNVNDVNITGQGCAKIWNKYFTSAIAFSAWGGRGLNFNRVRVQAKDVVMFGTEVGCADLALDFLDYKLEFTSLRNYPARTVVFAFTDNADYPQLSNIKIDTHTTNSDKPEFYSYVPCAFSGRIEYVGLPESWMDFHYLRNHQYDDDTVLVINGKTFGPQAHASAKVPVGPGPSATPFVIHDGIYIAGRMRVVNPGGMRAISDTYGNLYWGNGNPANGAPPGFPVGGKNWRNFSANNWFSEGPPGSAAAWSKYLAKTMLAWFQGTAPASIEVDYVYFPKK